jgi:hypothetical protein
MAFKEGGMFIKYKPKDPHIKTIPIVVETSGGETVPLANDSVILRPGTNELTESEWEAIQPHIQGEIKQKIIVPFTVEVKKKDGRVAKARTLKDVPVSVARKIIESCQNVTDLKKWVRQELPDEIMLLVLNRLRRLKIDPDEFTDDLDGEDTLDADITPEDGVDTEPESDAEGDDEGAEEDEGSGGEDDDDPDGEDDEGDDPEADDNEIPDFDQGK